MSNEEIDRDDPKFNQGVQHVVDLLAKTLGADDWVAGDGSEDYDCDLEQTLLNILAAKGLYDKDEAEFAALTVKPSERETLLTLLASQAQQIEDGRTIYDAGRRRIAELEEQLAQTVVLVERQNAWLEKIAEREMNISAWLGENAPYLVADQKHLDENTPERAYWHYGYKAALADTLSLTSTQHASESK